MAPQRVCETHAMAMDDFPELQRWIDQPKARMSPARKPEAARWPQVTLVTPSFNQASFLEKAIQSVLAQGYPNLEYMIFDGGSDDGSADIISRYAEQLSHWESEPDRGQAQAINKGWRRSTGEYLWWLNADDLLTPCSLFTSVEFMEAHPQVDLVYGDVIRIDDRHQIMDQFAYRDFDFERFLLEGHDIAQAGGLLRRDSLDRVGYLNEGLHYLMDKEYWLRLVLQGGAVSHLREPLAFFRIHHQAKTQLGGQAAAKEHLQVLVWLLENPGCPPRVKARRHIVLANAHRNAGRALVKAGRYKEALRHLGRALRAAPGTILAGDLWLNAALALLGLLVGEDTLNRGRSYLRALRRRWKRPG